MTIGYFYCVDVLSNTHILKQEHLSP